jgi:small nuclear ribonucleoprotein (snRNP)-like protein
MGFDTCLAGVLRNFDRRTNAVIDDLASTLFPFETDNQLRCCFATRSLYNFTIERPDTIRFAFAIARHFRFPFFGNDAWTCRNHIPVRGILGACPHPLAGVVGIVVTGNETLGATTRLTWIVATSTTTARINERRMTIDAIGAAEDFNFIVVFEFSEVDAVNRVSAWKTAVSAIF